MRKLLIAVAMVAALPLAACATIPTEKVESNLDRIERGINLASTLAEAAGAAGAIKPSDLAKIRSAVAKAREAIFVARAAVAAGNNAKAEELARQAEAEIAGIKTEPVLEPSPPG